MKLRIMFSDTYQHWVDVVIDGDKVPTKAELRQMAEAAKSGVQNLYNVDHDQSEREEIAMGMPEINGMEFEADDVDWIDNDHVRVEDDAVIIALDERGEENVLLYDEQNDPDEGTKATVEPE